MFSGPWQIVLLIAVIVLLFGGKKLPELARALGKAKGEFKKGTEEGEKMLEEEKAAEKKALADKKNKGKDEDEE